MKYKNIDANLDLVNVEKAILKNWDEKKIFDQINSRFKDKEWVYYDGPITANGLPHYGHAITWTLKDVVPRYYAMNGNFVSRNIGWDCQGILVEYEVEKKLGFTHKSQIEEMGIEKFNKMCRENVLSNRDKMVEYETRLGRWIDHNDEYSTMDSLYIESMWWALKTLHEKGLLYEGYKVVAYSPRTGMTLSTHEVADGGYKQVEDTAVTLKFKLSKAPNTYVLAWTTTPWTLPGNLMLAVGKKINYVKVEYEGNFYILANARVEEVFKGKHYKVVSGLKAVELEGLDYEPLFDFYKEKKSEGCFKIVFADHVNTSDGTGVVHLAPYGEEDFNVFMSMGIKMFDYLNETCDFTDEIPPYAGLFYKKANEKILEDLTTSGKLFYSEKYVHSMPVDYRSGTPLIYKPIKSWYVAVSKMKNRLVEEAKKINFVPEEVGKSRFVPWIENARDWSLSRLRFWGTPLPIWLNEETGDIKVIGSFKELEELSGQKLGDNFDPHKPFVDNIELKIGNLVYKRVPEVIDVWFDSGSMPFARYHYPFENKELFKKRFPAEYISEGDDQLHLWFYTMFLLGVCLFDETPFKNVIVIGMLGDEQGKKMSKSKGNYPPVEEVFEKYGSDMLRYFMVTSPVVRAEPTAFSYKALEETKKEFFTTCWNSLRYFITYASLHNFEATKNFSPANDLDLWAFERTHLLIKKVNEYMRKYEVMFAAREFAPFVQALSTWYIRRSRDRLAGGDQDALNTLYYMLNSLSILLAPFLPLFSDEMYLKLNETSKLNSVHLESYPIYNLEINDGILSKMELVREICSLGNAIRKEKNISLRLPLSKLKIKSAKLKNLELSIDLIEIIKDELNVKEVQVVQRMDKDVNLVIKEQKDLLVALDVLITDELKNEGEFRNLVREVQSMRKEANLNVSQKIELELEKNEVNTLILKNFEDLFKTRVNATNITLGIANKILKVL